jgi:hypothetical protein
MERFDMYVPPLMEVLGLVQLAHHPKNSGMRGFSYQLSSYQVISCQA